MRYSVRIHCADKEVCSKLESVLYPDNLSLPKDQRFTMAKRSESLLVLIESTRMMSALSSLESLLSDVNLFSEVWLLSHE